MGLLFFYLVLPCASQAETEERELTTFSFYLENDYFVGDDSQYTNGLKFAWSSPVYTGYPKKVWPHRFMVLTPWAVSSIS